MWLENEEINQQLKSNSPTAIAQAIAAIHLRWESGDQVTISPLNADILKSFGGEVPTEVLNPFLDFLLGVDGVPILEKPEAYEEFAKVITFFINTPAQYAAALRLKVDQNPVTATREVVARIDRLLDDASDDRLPHIEFFLSCLLDGTPEIRTVTLETLSSWSDRPARRTIVNGLSQELAEDEKKMLENLSK